MKKIIAASALVLAGFGLVGCTQSQADTTSYNLSEKAERFEIQRRITGINGITDKPAFFVEGRCSIENVGKNLEVTCKHGPDEYRKHFVGLSDNTFYVVEQLDAIDVSEFHTLIIVRPESLLPEIDLDTKAELGPDH